MTILADLPTRPASPLRAAIDAAYHADEDAAVEALLGGIAFEVQARERIAARARRLAQRIREDATRQVGLEAFLHAYSLDTHEGVMLMCLAEALLRIPDAATQDLLIKDKLLDVDWQRRVAGSEAFLLNASAFGLMLSGRVVALDRAGGELTTRLGRMVARLGEPVIREALRQAMAILGRQFVLGQTIEQAIERARDAHAQGFLYSFDMLGEGARTAADARHHVRAYGHALERIAAGAPAAPLHRRPSLSIKLSALHPRYELAKMARLRAALLPGLSNLLGRARALDVAVTIDAEESERLEPSLDLFETLATAADLAGWNGLGLAVQAYQKRAIHVIAWLAELAGRTGRRIPVRLVKGAYWDAEIKRAQALGVADYPVFTRKVATDVAYQACAKALLDGGELFYPQLATHNAQTLSAILELAGNRSGFELQKLHGMGETLYRDLLEREQPGVPCRVYAPVGSHKELLPYLVRRLLENGANSSFVHQVIDPEASLDALIADPIERLRGLAPKRHPAIPRPADLFQPRRANALGVDLTEPAALVRLRADIEGVLERPLVALPGTTGADALPRTVVRDPADHRRIVGEVAMADAATAEGAVARAHGGFRAWSERPVEDRAAVLERAAGLLEREHALLTALCVREAGKTLGDAVADWREAVDFLRYYAAGARRLMGEPVLLPGTTGERNRLFLHPRGVWAAISPWNFPAAIFTGQIAAALATGNTVVAKPAEQASLIAGVITGLLHEAGLPENALVLLPGEGGIVGPVLIGDPRIAGVVFTGGTETARLINRGLAAADGPIRPFIAETGGQNAMIVDSSALVEQVVGDTIESAFRSAGQRCSALRILCLQEEIAPRVLEMLQGAMAELSVGDPGLLSTDVGPVIDKSAQAALEAHLRQITAHGRVLFQCALNGHHEHGTFFPPTLVEIDRIDRLTEEAFGPILHVVRWRAGRLDELVQAIERTGYGLTFGVHSRIDDTILAVTRRIRAGNLYVNRTTIGAVVGAQPFGGEGLSGTGPKAGGPNYLLRFTTERTLSENMTAVGGNLALLGALED